MITKSPLSEAAGFFMVLGFHAQKESIGGAYNRSFPCMEATFPADLFGLWIVDTELVLYGIRELASQVAASRKYFHTLKVSSNENAGYLPCSSYKSCSSPRTKCQTPPPGNSWLGRTCTGGQNRRRSCRSPPPQTQAGSNPGSGDFPLPPHHRTSLLLKIF